MPITLSFAPLEHTQKRYDMTKILQEWHQQRLNVWQPGHLAATAIFNQQAVGVMQISKGDQQWLISGILVRKVTQNRGVAKQLVELTAQYASKQQASLQPDCEQQSDLITRLSQHAG